MADKKKRAPEEGLGEVDRWTSNGYGLRINGKKVDPEAETNTDEEETVEEIEEV